MRIHSITAALLAGASVSALALPAFAQTQLDEIVVTAQKREENLQDVPIAITVATSAQLDRQQIYSVNDLSRISPAVEVNSGGDSPGGGAQLRGLGTQTFTASAEASVGIVVDGVPQGNIPIANLFDLQRIEVLRGPQGMLFGQSASAGVLNMVTNAPNPAKFEGRFQFDYADRDLLDSRFDQRVVRAIMNIPLGENSALRFSASGDYKTGVQYNRFTRKDTKQSDAGFRARYLWEPSDTLAINLAADFSKTTNKGISNPAFTLFKAAPGTDVARAAAACGIVASDRNNEFCSDQPISSRSQIWGVSAQIDKDIGGHTLTSISSYRDSAVGPTFADIYRLVGRNPLITNTDGVTEANFFTQELRLTSPADQRLQYVAGLFYSKFESETRNGVFQVRIRTPFATIPVNRGESNNATESTAMAAFGQATFLATERLKLIVGARFQNQEVVANDFNRLTRVTTRGSVEEDSFSWRLGAQYDFSEDVMAYTSVSRGYKGPQINNADPLAPGRIIGSEKPTAYEVGMKATVLDGRMGVGANVFYTEVEGFQGQDCLVTPTGLQCGPQNFDVVSKGVELDFFGRPLEGLTLNGGLIYNSVTWPAGTAANDTGLEIGGEQLTLSPEWKFVLSGEYSRDLTESLEGFIAADTVYKSDIAMYRSVDPNLIYPAHWIVGARIGVRSEQGWGVALFGRNLTDEPEPTALFPSGVGVYNSWIQPNSMRVVGVSLDMRF